VRNPQRCCGHVCNRPANNLPGDTGGSPRGGTTCYSSIKLGKVHAIIVSKRLLSATNLLLAYPDRSGPQRAGMCPSGRRAMGNPRPLMVSLFRARPASALISQAPVGASQAGAAVPSGARPPDYDESSARRDHQASAAVIALSASWMPSPTSPAVAAQCRGTRARAPGSHRCSSRVNGSGAVLS
jgi:hypothetical protein